MDIDSILLLAPPVSLAGAEPGPTPGGAGITSILQLAPPFALGGTPPPEPSEPGHDLSLNGLPASVEYAMSVILGRTYEFDLTVQDGSGAAADTDAAPTAAVFEQGVAVAILTVTMVRRSLGNYVASVAVTSGNGFAVGKSYNVVATATRTPSGGPAITGKVPLASFAVAATDVDDLTAGGTIAVEGVILASPAPTTTQFSAQVAGGQSVTANVLKGRFANFEDGPCVFSSPVVKGHTAGTAPRFTLYPDDPLPTAPLAGDKITLIGKSGRKS